MLSYTQLVFISSILPTLKNYTQKPEFLFSGINKIKYTRQYSIKYSTEMHRKYDPRKTVTGLPNTVEELHTFFAT